MRILFRISPVYPWSKNLSCLPSIRCNPTCLKTHPNGRIRLVVRDLQSGVEAVVANDVQYVRAFWKPVAKE